MRGLGKGVREYKKAVNDLNDEPVADADAKQQDTQNDGDKTAEEA